MAKESEKFEIMSSRDHVILRPNMYVGSVSAETISRFVLGKWKVTNYVPALLKMIDEIIDNSIDEAIRTNFKYANQISVTVKPNKVTVTDNGRGIPHDVIVDNETKEEMLQPVAAWTRMRAGTSFDDDRVTIGANGVGSACVNFMSQLFIGETWRDNKMIRLRSSNGALKNNVDTLPISHNTSSGTSVTFTPDWNHLAVDSFNEGDTLGLIQDRLASLQISFPEIKFKLNGRLVVASTLKKYADMFIEDGGSTVTAQRKNIAFMFTSSNDGFRTSSYINGVHTRHGGAYNDWLVNNVTESLMGMIKRKYKVVINKSTIKNGLTFVLFARNFANPQFDSQTKERLTNTVAQVKEHYLDSDCLTFDQIAKKLMSCEDIIEPIVEAQVAKKLAADKRAAKLAQKKLRRVKVQKHVAATKKGGRLFLVEGDSAMAFMIKVRDPKVVGGFPLRGVVMNVFDKKPADVLKNKELSELIAVLNLDINDPDSVDNMDYGQIATLADADHDGNHIAGLLLSFFYKYWPRLFTEGKIAITRTPMMISTKGPKTKWFYNYNDAAAHKSSTTGWYHRYIKGLASLTEDEYDQIINQPVLDNIVIDNKNWFEVMFGKDSTPRKQWLKNVVPDVL